MAKKPSIEAAASKVKEVAAQAEGPSPNPMTNLIIADLALRGGGQLLRHAVERTMLGTAVARIAMRSVTGAILVGGGLLAKTLFDRRGDKRTARLKGQREIARQAQRGADETPKD